MANLVFGIENVYRELYTKILKQVVIESDSKCFKVLNQIGRQTDDKIYTQLYPYRVDLFNDRWTSSFKGLQN